MRAWLLAVLLVAPTASPAARMSLLSPRGRMEFDARTNTLFVTDIVQQPRD
jgi:hypothetical protein